MLAEAPNGVQKLRELILQLAVMGKLVPQDPEDEPASVLIEKIEAEKKRLVKEGKIRKSKQLPPIDREEILFKIPSNWKWIRLGQIGDWGAGATPNRKDPDYYGGKIKWFKSGELNEKYITESEEKITEIALKDCSLRTNKKGDVLIAMYGATIGKVAILNTEATTNQAVCACTCFPGVYNEYLFILLKAYKQYFTNQGAGGAQPNISRIKIINTIAPLPPLAEQKRIVSKVDELMARCDQLEARQQKKKELRSKLNSAALDKMLSAESQDEFEENWRRICENFDLIYDNPENVEKLRKAVLQLAVQGKLVEQNPEDESASVLIEEIKAEKKKLIKEREIKNIKVKPINNEMLPFELPFGWEFVRFGDITKKLGAGSTPRGGKSVYQETGVKFIRSQNVWNNGLKLENVARIPREIHEKMNGTFVEPGDILLNITGASIGRSSLVPDDFDEGNVSQHVAIVRPIDETTREYLHLCIISPYIQDSIMSEQVGISREGLSMTRLKEFMIPIPPLNEQKSIVEKIEQLMGLCDELEGKLRSLGKRAENLWKRLFGVC